MRGVQTVHQGGALCNVHRALQLRNASKLASYGVLLKAGVLPIPAISPRTSYHTHSQSHTFKDHPDGVNTFWCGQYLRHKRSILSQFFFRGTTIWSSSMAVLDAWSAIYSYLLPFLVTF